MIANSLKPLETEINAFEEQLPALREKHAVGTYVLFIGACMVGTFSSYSKALDEGFERVGTKPFLVKQISKEGEEVQFVYGLQA